MERRTRTIEASEITAHLQSALTAEQMVGCAVAVIDSRGALYQNTFGVKSVLTQEKITETTAFRIASISKTFTGVAVLQLVEQGLIDLDQPLSDVLRSYQWDASTVQRPATIQELLTHTSGVGELLHWKDLLTSGNVLIRPRKPRLALADLYQGKITPEVEPGTKWAYSNHAFATLGQIVEDISGETYIDYLKKHIFLPLEMGNTDINPEKFESQLATGHQPHPRKETLSTVAWLDISVLPAGGLISTIGDMAKYASVLLSDLKQDSHLLLSQDMVNNMFSSHWETENCFSSQGLAFLLGDLHGHRLVWHDGAAPGFISSLLLLPDDDLGVVVLSNAFSSGARSIGESVLSKIILNNDDQQASFKPRKNMQNRLVGTYAPLPGAKTNLRFFQQFGPELVIERREEKLFISALNTSFREGIELNAINEESTCYRGEVRQPDSALVTPIYLDFKMSGGEKAMKIQGIFDLPFQVNRISAWRSARTMTVGAAVGLSVVALGFVHRKLRSRA